MQSSRVADSPPNPAPIVWLASYPKAGNTWVRYLLYSYFFGPPPSTDDLTRRVPDLHLPGALDRAEAHGGRLFVKSHFMRSHLHPFIERTGGFVYVARNPADMLLSNLRYRPLLYAAGTQQRVDDAAYALEFVRGGGDSRWYAMGYGTILEHAESWLGAPGDVPHAVVRYEDLKADAARALARVLGALGIEADLGRCEAAARVSSFEQMRAAEVREKRSKASDAVFNGTRAGMAKGLLFMRSGQSGQSLDTIRPGLDEALRRRLKPYYERFGYAD